VEFLVKKAQRGDAEAFIALMEENKQGMYKVAKGFLRNEEDVADVMQETVLDCYEKIGTLKQSAYFKTWMIRILMNNCKDMIRKKKGDVSIETVPEAADRTVYEQPENFQEMIEPLRERDRSIFTLYYLYGLKIKEIAACMQMNENTVASRLKRGRKTLQAEIQSGGRRG